jgi:hypothetical protein
MRYAIAAVLCATSILFIVFAVSAGSAESLLLGVSGIAASAGIVAQEHEAERYLCAAVLLVNAVMITLGAESSGSAFSFVLAALSLAAAIGLVLRQQWVRIPTVITSVMTVGGWAAAAMRALLEQRWPDADVGAGFISLVPGLLLAAIWIWCAFAVARIATPNATTA